ncbi:MAG: class I adenylate-forming enzyme family protein [Ferroplasma sp.]
MLEIIRNNSPSKDFIKYFGSSISYGDFDGYTNGVSIQLSMYSGPGDRIAIISENIPQFIIVQYAAWKNACIFVPLSPLDSATEIQEKISLVQPAAIIISSEFMEKFQDIKTAGKILITDPQTFGTMPGSLSQKFGLKPGKEELNLRKKKDFIYTCPDPEDVAMLVFTSGTSGRQKAAEIRHKNIYAASFIYKEWFHVTGHDVNLGIAPFFHITGLTFGISLSVISASSIVLNYRFDNLSTLDLIKKYRTTITMFVATAYRSMINSWSVIPHIKSELSSMRLWSAGGMPMPVKTENEWRELTGQWIYMAYGLTESTSPVTLWEYPYNGALKVYNNTLSCGLPVYYTILHRRRNGELAVKGAQIISGYYKNRQDTEKTFRNGEMKTGDICHIGSDSWVYIIDRKKDLIDISGYKVWPAEIENVVRKSPYVEDVVVASRPDEYKGEVPVAYVKARNNTVPASEIKENIMEICRKELSRYKIPSEIVFIEQMPVSASGKIKRSDINKILEAKK